MKMNSDRASRSRCAARRLRRLKERPDAKRFAAQYRDWSQSGEGIMTTTQLCGLIMLHLAQKLSRAEYRGSVRQLAQTWRFPAADWDVFVRITEDLIHCTLSGSGQLVSPRF